MKPILFIFLILLPISAHADFFGGDLPLLTEIVTNTLNTLYELQRQTHLFNEEMDGITDKITRIETISRVVQPSTWNEWRDPNEALRRLKQIYYTLPKDYSSEKSDVVTGEISKAMNLIAQTSDGANSSFRSGKEMERRGADASPGVAQKLTASGTGTLIAMQAQTQVIESHITSLLAQMLADANEKESREVVSKAQSLSGMSENLGPKDGRFSTHASQFGQSR